MYHDNAQYLTSSERLYVSSKVIELQEQIDRALPPGSVIPAHTDKGHFYVVPKGTYPSVTGAIGIIKDPSIQQFQMNEALRYIEKHLESVIQNGKVDMLKAIDLLHEAKNAPSGVLKDAGDIGTKIHDRREEYFQDWIDNKNKPDIQKYLRADDDPRIWSGMRALEKFVNENLYVPVRCEVMVYSDRYKMAGMLDDLGLIRTVIRSGDNACSHDYMTIKNVTRCPKCDYKARIDVALMDLKTSNQFKDHYFYQVALYHMMFKQLTGVQMDRNFILKVSKENGQYKIEELQKIRSLVAGAKKILEAGEAVRKVKEIRQKATAKKVIKI